MINEIFLFRLDKDTSDPPSNKNTEETLTVFQIIVQRLISFFDLRDADKKDGWSAS